MTAPTLSRIEYGSEQAIHDTSWACRPIGLDDLVESADLQTRVDRKYWVSAHTFTRLITELRAFNVLEIDGKRTHDYESVYFDTPDLLTYRQHVQRRRRRFKARTRTYVDSGLCMFEIKTTGARGNTVKDRIRHPIDHRAFLTQGAYQFMARTLWTAFGQPVPYGMRAALVSLYRRTTFASLSEGARLTCDVALSCHTADASLADRGTHVLVESKSASGNSQADQMLRRLGVRPVSMSKYCVGVAALYPWVSDNVWRTNLSRHFEPPSPVLIGGAA
jgi:hypothetical protein